MFCFPNTFGRRERGPLRVGNECTDAVTVEEPASPSGVGPHKSPSPRTGRWRKRISTSSRNWRGLGGQHVGDTSTSCSSSSSSTNNSRSNSCNREHAPSVLSLVSNQHKQHEPEPSDSRHSPLSNDECVTSCTDNAVSPTGKQSPSDSRHSPLSNDECVTSCTDNTVSPTGKQSPSDSRHSPLSNDECVTSCTDNTVSPTPNSDSMSPPTTSSASSSYSARQSSVESGSSSSGYGGTTDIRVPTPTPTPGCVGSGPRFKLLREGDIQVCYLNHTRTVVSKILSSKFLRRWETHRLYLNDAYISSKTPTGFLEVSVPYSGMEEVYVVTRWDAGHKFCIRIVVSDGSLLLQANSSYTRDQWFHSILWKKNIFKYRNILKPTSRPEVILKELKSLVDYATSTPLQDECVINVPIQIVSDLLVPETTWTNRATSEELITSMAPLLDNTTPSPEMCRFFSQHCVTHPRSPVVADLLTPTIHRILKHNVDFGKYPHMRQLIQDYIQALYVQNGGEEVVRNFVSSIHGPSSGCPHLRVLPNLVSVCLAAAFSVFEEHCSTQNEQVEEERSEGKTLQCYMAVILNISEYDDWRPGLAQLLQPVPFPDEALANKSFLVSFMPVMERIIADPHCDVHQMVLGIREGKEGWFHVYCPSNMVFADDGSLWCLMVGRLLSCCGRRKHFLSLLVKQLGACLLLAIRDHSAAQEALCLMLEWQLVEQEDQKMQIVTTLQSTPSGRDHYSGLCQRQKHLRELQQKGGPRKLTLPSRSTDADIARLLSCGSFGNLVCLSLAFTHVTSTCAEELIKLPALRYLNLWATQFGDPGLLMISEHLHKLQVLNLCETPVTDRGIAALSSMTNLRKLNLNSTKLTAQTFECLKQKLPGLQECDVRYTEAW